MTAPDNAPMNQLIRDRMRGRPVTDDPPEGTEDMNQRIRRGAGRTTPDPT